MRDSSNIIKGTFLPKLKVDMTQVKPNYGNET